jgi:bacterioferritin B
MPSERFVQALNEQIEHEFSAHQAYVAVAVHFDSETLPQLASFFYRQALEEREHAMMMIQYLMDAGTEPKVPGVDAPTTDFPDIVAPVQLALDQERKVTDQIQKLSALAREEGDLTSEQFLSWFLKEQVEEVATMSSLLHVVQRSKDNPMLVEDFLAREHSHDDAVDPTAPPAAGD